MTDQTTPTDPRDPAPGAGQLDLEAIQAYWGYPANPDLALPAGSRSSLHDIYALASEVRRLRGAVADLRAENARYRAALIRYLDTIDLASGAYGEKYRIGSYGDAVDAFVAEARAALAAGTQLRWERDDIFVREPAGAAKEA